MCTDSPRILALLIAVLATTACAMRAGERLGAGVSKGAVHAAQQSLAEKDPTMAGPVAERTSRGTVQGVLGQATQPQQLDELRLVADAAAAAVLRGLAHAGGDNGAGAVTLIADQTASGATRAFSRELGTGGDGPLARSLYATGEQLSASLMRGAVDELQVLFPDCRGPDRERCLAGRVTALSRAVSLGLRDGLGGLVAWPVLITMFVLGAVVASVLAWIIVHYRGTAAATQVR